MLAEKLPDLANLCAGVLVFGQFVGDRPVSTGLLLAGFGVWIVLLACALVIAGDEP